MVWLLPNLFFFGTRSISFFPSLFIADPNNQSPDGLTVQYVHECVPILRPIIPSPLCPIVRHGNPRACHSWGLFPLNPLCSALSWPTYSPQSNLSSRFPIFRHESLACPDLTSRVVPQHNYRPRGRSLEARAVDAPKRHLRRRAVLCQQPASGRRLPCRACHRLARMVQTWILTAIQMMMFKLLQISWILINLILIGSGVNFLRQRASMIAMTQI